MLSMEMQSAHISHGIGSLPSSLTHHASTVGTHHHHHNNHTHHLHRQHHSHPHSSNSSISNNNNNTTTTAGQHTQPHHVHHLQHLESSSILQINSNDHCHTQAQQQVTQLQTPQTLSYDIKPKVHKLDEYCLTSNGNTITTNTSTGSTAQVPTNYMPQTAVEWITVMNENHNNAEDSHSSQGSISGDAL